MLSSYKTLDLKNTLKESYKEFQEYFNPRSEYGIGWTDCLYEISNKLGVKCKKVDEGIVEFADE